MLQFTIPRTRAAPSHPSNAPCPMRPQTELYDYKPFYYHPGRIIKPQRISFYDLPYEIHLMIYQHTLRKDFEKLPSHREIVARNPQLVRQENETLLMGDAMEDFLQMPVYAALTMLEDGLGVDAWDEQTGSEVDGGSQEDEDTSDDTDSHFGDTEPEDPAASDLITPNNPPATIIFAPDPIALLPPGAYSTCNTWSKPKTSKKITYNSNGNAFDLLRSAQRRASPRQYDTPYINTDWIWGLLSLIRSCRLIYRSLSPLLIPYLARLTVEIYRHEVLRINQYTTHLINNGLDTPKFDSFVHKNQHLLYWDQIDEDEIRADEEANPDGYAGLTPFNQFVGWEYDEYEYRIHREEERDWTGVWCGVEGRAWEDVWQLFSLICTSCHDRNVMGEFLEGYCKEVERLGKHWTKWVVRDVFEKTLGYCRFDPWVGDVVRKEFGLARGLRQSTMDEFMVRLDGRGKKSDTEAALSGEGGMKD